MSLWKIFLMLYLTVGLVRYGISVWRELFDPRDDVDRMLQEIDRAIQQRFGSISVCIGHGIAEVTNAVMCLGFWPLRRWRRYSTIERLIRVEKLRGKFGL